jgi:hypothetical protein
MRVGQDAKNETIPAYFKKTSDSIETEINAIRRCYIADKFEKMLLSEKWEIKREKKAVRSARITDSNEYYYYLKFEHPEIPLPENLVNKRVNVTIEEV